MEALSAETSLPLIYALSSALRAPNHPTRRLIAVILMVMKKARDLALRRSRLREVGEGSRVIEELRWILVGRVPHRMMTAAPRHSRIFLWSPRFSAAWRLKKPLAATRGPGVFLD